MNQQSYYGWWQRDDLCYQHQHLFFAGRSVQSLADQFGSPTFVYSAARVKENLERLHGALIASGLAGRFSLCYAMKANRFAPLLTFLKQTGLCGIDACSPAEVEHAVSCGFSPAEISFTASSLSTRDLHVLARYDGLFMDCDSLHAIRSWGALKPGTKIGIRINPAMGIGRAANDKLQYAGETTTKFGIYWEQFAEALELARSYGLKVAKIHFHTGCGYLTPQLEQLERIIGHCMRFVDAAGGVERVNIGGGLGVPHLASDQSLDLKRWAEVLHRQCAGRGLHLEIEPGDYIVKDAGIFLLEKTFVEQKKNTVFVGVDAGFNLAPEPAYYSLPFQPLPLRYDQSPCTPMNVVGNVNEALDVWYEQALLPNLTGHTHLVLINAGAYSSSMASNHCMRGQFKEFLLF
ncbi:diaminopimelate decarboxylase [uncultured Desulfobulbus sp.]|uniref:diaminopimelate decarboxylase n=1 Tax=uncultured Desulfobulbus sp. TaxID=239745 RepID=UPI0029C6AEB7|nr:diaminopimelate decarboxylase [uncultured Desulfobulbus sp.]